MELAMHCRDSDDRQLARAFYGSEWTVCVCRWQLFVAFPGSVRQQLLESSEEPRKKVSGFGQCYSLWCASSGSTEASRHMLFWAGFSLPSRLSTIADCVQCV